MKLSNFFSYFFTFFVAEVAFVEMKQHSPTALYFVKCIRKYLKYKSAGPYFNYDTRLCQLFYGKYDVLLYRTDTDFGAHS
jgi:hypothetical protein